MPAANPTLCALTLTIAFTSILSSDLTYAEQVNTQTTISDDNVIGIPVMPMRGMTSNQVSTLYGQPEKKEPAVGNPPISSWVYDGFIVYFESQYVIHSLATDNGK